MNENGNLENRIESYADLERALNNLNSLSDENNSNFK